MSQIPENLRYTEEHEWVLVEGEQATIGITDFAQSSLGDIVFVELPEAGSSLNAGATFGVVESIKSVSDLYSPVSGEVVEANEELTNTPELCNQAPYESWMIKIKMTNVSEVEKLMNAQEYDNYCQEES